MRHHLEKCFTWGPGSRTHCFLRGV